VLALASLTSFMVILDMLVVATALTAIRQALGASLEELAWTVSAYTLSSLWRPGHPACSTAGTRNTR
jgi:MFS family permease